MEIRKGYFDNAVAGDIIYFSEERFIEGCAFQHDNDIPFSLKSVRNKIEFNRYYKILVIIPGSSVISKREIYLDNFYFMEDSKLSNCAILVSKERDDKINLILNEE